uniref:Uncharacterized protein n=1 Tax=Leersia perrieri TaxID=77586 RepID=A0A0D9X1T6_9ORYZ
MKLAVIAVALLLPLVAGAADIDEFDFFYFVQQKCWPEYCDNSNQLLTFAIRDLIRELAGNWPTLSCKNGGGGPSIEFWAYEWKKHGTCSGLGQHGYFAAALDLKRLAGILAGAGIVPSEDAWYPLSAIRAAIADVTGAIPNLECQRDAFGETQLYQVYQCVARDGKTLIDCEHPMSGRCSDRVKLPPFY